MTVHGDCPLCRGERTLVLHPDPEGKTALVMIFCESVFCRSHTRRVTLRKRLTRLLSLFGL